LTEGAEGEEGKGGEGAVEAAAEVAGDGVHGVGHAGAEAGEVWAKDEVERSGVSFEGDAAGEERNELLVGVEVKGGGEKGEVELGLDGLVEVEGRDGGAGNVVAEVPDGALAARVEARLGDDARAVGWALGGGAEGSTGGDVGPVERFPGDGLGPAFGADDVGGREGSEAGGGRWVGGVDVRGGGGRGVRGGKEGEAVTGVKVIGVGVKEAWRRGGEHGSCLGADGVGPGAEVRVGGGLERGAEGGVVVDEVAEGVGWGEIAEGRWSGGRRGGRRRKGAEASAAESEAARGEEVVGRGESVQG